MILIADIETDGLPQYVRKEDGVTLNVMPKILEVAARIWWPGHARHGERFDSVVGWADFDRLKMHDTTVPGYERALNNDVEVAFRKGKALTAVRDAWNAWVPKNSWSPCGKNFAGFDGPILKAFGFEMLWAKHRVLDIGSVLWRGGTIPESKEIFPEAGLHRAAGDVDLIWDLLGAHCAEKQAVRALWDIQGTEAGGAVLPEWLKIAVAGKYSPLSR